MTLYRISKKIRDHIAADERIAACGIGVTYTDAGDVANEIDEQLESVGLHVNVRAIEWSPQTSGGHTSVGFAVATIAVGELVGVNRANDGFVTAQDLAEYLMMLLNGAKIEGAHGPLNLAAGPKLEVDEKNEMNLVTISFRFQHLITPESVAEVFQ